MRDVVAFFTEKEADVNEQLYGIGDTEQGPHCQREIVNDTRTPFCQRIYTDVRFNSATHHIQQNENERRHRMLHHIGKSDVPAVEQQYQHKREHQRLRRSKHQHQY